MEKVGETKLIAIEFTEEELMVVKAAIDNVTAKNVKESLHDGFEIDLICNYLCDMSESLHEILARK